MSLNACSRAVEKLRGIEGMSNFCQMTQRTIKIGNMVERRITPYSVSFAQVKFSEKEAAMLRHDLCEVEVSLAQWGLMVVGLIYVTRYMCVDSKAQESDFSFLSVPQKFCSLPGLGWLGDIPLSEVDVYQVTDCALKCGKTVYALTIRGGHAKKVMLWYRKKVFSYTREIHTVRLISKNVSDPKSRELYGLMPRVETLIEDRVFRSQMFLQKTY